MKSALIILVLLITNYFSYAQEKSVAITMDDLFLAYGDLDIKGIETSNNTLLNSVTKLNIPVTVFINAKSFYQPGELDKRISLFTNWVNSPLITIGNHTYSHLNYSETGLEQFADDIIKNEALTTELLKNVKKDMEYFRFPFNCTGKDTISRTKIYKYLQTKGYIITPFTIESADYMFNSLYCYYLKNGNHEKANKIIEQYINLTADLFIYFESVANKLYGRNIRHIYLCHTNQLNAACLEKLVERISGMGYKFISLDDALSDKVYQNNDYYYGHFGFSWIYRWIENTDQRKTLMRNEPYLKEVEDEYNKLVN